MRENTYNFKLATDWKKVVSFSLSCPFTTDSTIFFGGKHFCLHSESWQIIEKVLSQGITAKNANTMGKQIPVDRFFFCVVAFLPSFDRKTTDLICRKGTSKCCSADILSNKVEQLEKLPNLDNTSIYGAKVAKNIVSRKENNMLVYLIKIGEMGLS